MVSTPALSLKPMTTNDKTMAAGGGRIGRGDLPPYPPPPPPPTLQLLLNTDQPNARFYRPIVRRLSPFERPSALIAGARFRVTMSMPPPRNPITDPPIVTTTTTSSVPFIRQSLSLSSSISPSSPFPRRLMICLPRCPTPLSAVLGGGKRNREEEEEGPVRGRRHRSTTDYRRGLGERFTRKYEGG